MIESSIDHQNCWYLRLASFFYLSNAQVFLKNENKISPFEDVISKDFNFFIFSHCIRFLSSF